MGEKRLLTYEQPPKGRVFFVPGVGNYVNTAFRNFADSLSDRGYGAHVLEHPKPNTKWSEEKIKLEKDLEKAKELSIRLNAGNIDREKLEKILATIPTAIFKEAKNLINEIEKVTSEPVQIVAHSMGAMTASIAAILRPDLFKAIVMVSPLGFTERNKNESEPSKALEASIKAKEGRSAKAEKMFRSHLRVTNLIMRYLWYGIREKDIPSEPGFKGIWHYLRERFLAQLHNEIYDMANSDIVPLVDALNNDLGIEITVISNDSDRIFSSEKIKERVPEGVNLIETEDKGHLGIQKEGEVYAEIVDEIFTLNRENGELEREAA